MASAAKGVGTARRRSGRDAVRLSQELLRHLPSGIVFFNREGCVAEANPAARAALGFAQPLGLTLVQLFREAELREGDGSRLGPAAELMAEALASNRILQRKNMRYTTPGGRQRQLGVTLFPLREGEETSGLICLLTDLTAIHALEEELQRRKNLSALGEMAAGIAHEFKNALATISGYGQMLRGTLPEGPEGGRDHADKLLEQVATLNSIATEFLVFARPLAVQPERVELGRLLRECAEATRMQEPAPERPGAVKIEIQGRFPAVAGDPVLLASAFVNLLRNACEAIQQSGHGSRVTVHAAGHEGKAARVQVSDDGPGVAPEVAEKIFIPFFTTKASGTGLGLSMVHKIVTAHQGSILLTDSAPGHTV
ncbi:MAG: two-component system sensor histidine kinase NtrB, partial [Terriglobales bacterium]